MGGEGAQTEDKDETIKPLPDRLVLDLTAARTVALRNALASDPVMASIAVLHAFVLKTFYLCGSGSCLEVTLQSARFSQIQGLGDTVWTREMDQRREAWGRDLPKYPNDIWEFPIVFDEASRQALFAHGAAEQDVALTDWLRPFVEKLGHKKRRQMCPSRVFPSRCGFPEPSMRLHSTRSID
ncbi:Hypothetical protein NGAL_HAMBI2610_20120 [Neorhizobium galegae bv. orientalis]|nr:Hypothetical protein NGAL_HAMBI2610_20120 [Neorhizobium galegae bv. orientalis]